MNDLKIFLLSKDIHPKAFTKMGKVIIIEDKKKKIVLKKDVNNKDIYEYLLSRKFYAFPKCYSVFTDEYEITEFISDLAINKDQKVNDLLLLLAELHLKTKYVKEVTDGMINQIYRDLKKKIIVTRDYYIKLNDMIDQERFLSPSRYLLIRNISLFYYLLDKSLKLLEEWKRSIYDKKQMYYSLVYNSVSIDHLIVNNEKYLINWDKASFGLFMDDIKNFYRNYFSYLGLEEVFKLYNSINKLDEGEEKLLLVQLSIPKMIQFEKNTLYSTTKVKREIDYLKKIDTYFKRK